MAIVLFIGGLAALIALFLSIRALSTDKQTRVRASLEGAPVRTFLVGAVATLLGAAAVIGLLSLQLPPLGLISILLGASLAGAALFGLSATAGLLGERVLALRNRPTSQFTHTWFGTLLLAVLAAIPFLGWFLIGPVAVMLSLGAVLMALRRQPTGPVN